MKFFDQFDDRGFKRLTIVMERNVRDKVSRGGIMMVSDYRNGTLDINDVMRHIAGGTGSSGYDDAMDMMSRMLSGVERMRSEVGIPESLDSFRPALGAKFECAVPGLGVFPVNDPLQALMSYMYARAQQAPENVMIRIKMPMSDFFGPRTAQHIEHVIDNVPEKLITDPSNKIPEYADVKDGLPPYHTFLPELIKRIKGINDLTKGKLNDILKEISKEYMENRSLTMSDRGFQKRVLDALETLVGKSEVYRISRKQPGELVFNTRLPAGRPGILRVKDMLLDRSKLESMTFKECTSSFSPQIAEAIFDDDKKKLDVELLTRLIERLTDLDVPEEEKKELQDRVLSPIKHFFEPEEDVLDKIMMVNII